MIETKKSFEMVELAEVSYRDYTFGDNMATLVPMRTSLCNRRLTCSRRRALG